MKRLLAVTLAFAVIAGAVALSQNAARKPISSQEGLQVEAESRNPWTHLKVNNDADDFQFAIVSDRTGGHRAKIFSRAVEQLNLLQPEFVLSVGDLIEGYTTDRKKSSTSGRSSRASSANCRCRSSTCRATTT